MSSEALTSVVTNTTLTDADTEYSVDVSGYQYFTVQCRTSVDVRFAFVTGKVATPTAPYMTLKADSSYSSPEKIALLSSKTIFLASGTGGAVVEICGWKP